MRSKIILSCALALKKYNGVAITITSALAILVKTGFASSLTAHSYSSNFWHRLHDIQPLDLYLRSAVLIISISAPKELAPSQNHSIRVAVLPFFLGLPDNIRILLAKSLPHTIMLFKTDHCSVL